MINLAMYNKLVGSEPRRDSGDSIGAAALRTRGKGHCDMNVAGVLL